MPGQDSDPDKIAKENVHPGVSTWVAYRLWYVLAECRPWCKCQNGEIGRTALVVCVCQKFWPIVPGSEGAPGYFTSRDIQHFVMSETKKGGHYGMVEWVKLTWIYM